MTEFLQFLNSNCKNCYKCIRHCPVKSIRFSGHQAHIVADECILCGQCFVVCPQNAKAIRSDLEKAQLLLMGEEPVYASIAPSFVANYPGCDIASLETALRQLGFAGVEETALGATQVKEEYERRLAKNGGRQIMISSCCPSVNLLIQKHYPEALCYLAPVASPMLAHARQIKARHPDAKVIFIGPCVAKKAEAEQNPEDVACALTFDELTGWLEQKQISLTPAPPSTAKPTEGKARLFPTAGGILRSMSCAQPGLSYLCVDGTSNCLRALEDILSGDLDHCFIEMSACSGSCTGGPVMEKNRHSPVQRYLAVDRYAGTEDFSVHPAPSLEYQHPYLGIHQQLPGSQEITQILAQMGKTRPEDELNCGSCGYDTCREKAIAVYQGKADLTMCLPFLKEKAESFSDQIINNTPNAVLVLSEMLEVQQINKAACQLFRIRRESDLLGEQIVRILDPSPFASVLRTGKGLKETRMYLAEYEKSVDLTILYDTSYRILICLFRDVTREVETRQQQEEQTRRTMETADQVVDKQMRVVQEIASLLGETAAETKIALTKLKESIQHE